VDSALEHWHDFYVLLGTAAAALVALLFVAAAVGAGFLTPERSAGRRTYMSPVVFHFAGVLVGSLIALAPSHTTISFGLLAALIGIAGVGYSAFVLTRLLKNPDSDPVDRFAYGAIPLLAYVAVLAAAGFNLKGSEIGLELYAASLVVVLIVNIRNAWDLTIAMVHHHAGG